MAQYGPLAATAGSHGGSLGAGSLANASQLLVAALQEGPSPVTEAPIGPGEAPVSIHYSVTIVITVLVGILFLLVYVQLVMVICFGYKLLTYQTVLLFDILLWASLRLTLYSFYFYHCCEQVDKLDKTVLGWFLVSLPPCLQFFSLAVLVHYFSEVRDSSGGELFSVRVRCRCGVVRYFSEVSEVSYFSEVSEVSYFE